ncbi:MAG: hypothetical protein KGH60_00330 [Candidatus Micrarchaeota archaeon]|nr:hypothetical protein [Candidatus Micrarchaeota archaeon]
MVSAGLLEYAMTAGIVIAFAGLIMGAILDRRGIRHSVSGLGFRKKHFLMIIAIIALFVVMELVVIKPTQLLFFDDAIYQAMGQSLLHSGQAWMCDYGTPLTCFSGEIFHEPIGLSFNFAMAFLLFGIKLPVAFGTGLVLGAVSVFMTFFVALMLLKRIGAASFAMLLMALTPVLLVWAQPTNSDVATLAYSLIAIFFMLMFSLRKTKLTLINMLLSMSLLMYMKVFALLYIPVLLLMYLFVDDKNIISAIRKNLSLIKRHALDTWPLVALLIFVVSLAPQVIYAQMQLTSGNYGYQGTSMQNTCTNDFAQATGSINIMNAQFNICSNILFWFNSYKNVYVMQPFIYTVLAIIGAALLLIFNRKGFAALAIWFVLLFALYDAFYAGSVLYGVDWRFMLGLVAQTCILGGFAAYALIDYVNKKTKNRAAHLLSIAAVVVLIAYPAVAMYQQLSISPSNVPQAGDARFYEGFVYNQSQQIPASCLVYTYDPTLFNINNRTATQIGDLYNQALYANYSAQYSCMVLDYGYWCHTPNNECTYANQSFTLAPIATATYSNFNYRYGFYYLTKKS